MVKQIMRSSSEPNSMFAEYKRAEIYISCGDSMAEDAVVKEGWRSDFWLMHGIGSLGQQTAGRLPKPWHTRDPVARDMNVKNQSYASTESRGEVCIHAKTMSMWGKTLLCHAWGTHPGVQGTIQCCWAVPAQVQNQHCSQVWQPAAQSRNKTTLALLHTF